MKLWDSDEELFAITQRELFTSVVGDVMDRMRLFHQFLPPQIRPLHPEMVVLGRAMPVLSVEVFEEKIEGSANELSVKSFGLMLEALDDLRPNEIYVNTGSSPRNAMWGELMSTRAGKLGARGAVLNGYVRDTKAILKLNFPTFAFGSYGQDAGPRYKVYDFRIPIEIGGVRVNPGDILFGDIERSAGCSRPSRDRSVYSCSRKSTRGEDREERVGIRIERGRGVSQARHYVGMTP